MIEAYLRELDGCLRLPRRLRARALAEARDHLLCAAERDGEAEAIARFGAPSLVARRFAEEVAAGSSRWATVVTAAAVLSVGAVVALNDGARGPLAFLAGQVAATCLVLGLVRVLRHRHDAAVPAAKLRYVDRANATALVAAAAAGAGHMALPVLVAPIVVGAVCVARAAARTRGLASLADEPTADRALDDLVALPGLHALAGPAASARRHPWRFCALVALAAGGSLAAAHGIAEGPPRDAAAALASSGLLIAIEGGAVVTGYAALGRWLGLR